MTDYVILPGADYRGTCDAVREKSGKTGNIRSGELAQEIRDIQPKLQEKTVTPSQEEQEIAPDGGFEGLSLVHVGAIPGEYVVPSETLEITENGTYDVKQKESVTVAVPGQRMVDITIDNQRADTTTIYYYSADTNEIIELELEDYTAHTVSVPAFSQIYLATSGSYATSSSSSQRRYLCVHTAVNAYVKRRSDNYAVSGRVYYLYDLVIVPYDDGATITLTY